MSDKNTDQTVEAMKKSLTDLPGVESVSFVSEEGGTDAVVYDFKNTQAEKEAVDKGVQAELPKDARWHRREARRLLNGKKGLTNEQKVERMERAKSHLEQSIALEIQGWE